MQNYSAPFNPLDLRPVPESNWRMFSNLNDAQLGMGMIESVTLKSVMVDSAAVGGFYAQYVYLIPGSDIRCRLAYGLARDAAGDLAILEYPSDIFDRDSIPMPLVDKYTPGQPHVLRVARISETLGQLYWQGV
jgi:hypothetical protein